MFDAQTRTRVSPSAYHFDDEDWQSAVEARVHKVL